MAGADRWAWEIATKPDEVHELLCACDAHQGRVYGSPVPVRRPASTLRHVRAGAVHLLRAGPDPVAMFTLTWQPSFPQDVAALPACRRPAYLSRLAVRPEQLAAGSLLGVRCVRKAIETAADSGADALRAEANPDLLATVTLLGGCGFVQYGPRHTDADGRHKVYLQRDLLPH